MLHELSLSAFQHRRVSTLSGGTRRLVQLAAALLGRKRVLILDEPCAGLDPTSRLVHGDVVVVVVVVVVYVCRIRIFIYALSIPTHPAPPGVFSGGAIAAESNA